MPNITDNQTSPYENDEFDILVGTRDEDGSGDDRDYFFGQKGPDQAYGPAGTGGIYDSNGTDGKDVIDGNSWDNTINGGADVDVIHGGDGEDHLYGGSGVDFLFGEGDSDVLYGNEDDDWLEGGSGNDTLVGGQGKDWLIGGTGWDWFLFNVPSPDSFMKPDSADDDPDVIKDFSTFEDVIGLQGWGISPHPSQYDEDKIEDTGYDAARTRAETLLNNDNSMLYAFVTDGVDGYLFVDLFKGPDDPGFEGLWEGVEMGIKLEGLTNLNDFSSANIFSIV